MARDFKELCDKISNEISDPRRTTYGHILHSLCDILIIALCAIHSGCKTYVSIANYGEDHMTWFKTFLHLDNGVPSRDTFRRCLERVLPESLSACLYEWLGIFDHQLEGASPTRRKHVTFCLPLTQKTLRPPTRSSSRKRIMR